MLTNDHLVRGCLLVVQRDNGLLWERMVDARKEFRKTIKLSKKQRVTKN